MGDRRFNRPYLAVKEAEDPAEAIRGLTDEDVIAALAAAAAADDALTTNVLATDVQNRVSLYAAILTTMAEGVFAVGPQGRLTAMNPAAQNILGWTLEETRHDEMDALLSCTVADRRGIWRSRAVCAEALHAEGPKREEDALFTRRDGTRFPASYAAAPILRDGEPQGAVVVFRDITERRRTEETLRQLAEIVQASNDAIYSQDMEGRVTNWNSACERLFGYTADEIVGSAAAVLYAPHRAHDDRVLLGRVERGETVRHYETQRVTKDGRVVDVSLSIAPLRNPEGRIVGSSAINRDIRERVHAGRELRETQHLLEAIVEGTTNIVYAKDLDGKYLLLNHAGVRLFGIGQEALIGKTDGALFGPDEVERIREQEKEVIAGGAPRTFEETLTIRGTPHVYLTTKAPLLDADGRVVGIVGNAHDITERRQSEDAARRLAAIVEASDDAILSLSLDGTILTWNPRAEQLYGYPAADAIGKHATLVVPPELRESFEQLLARVRSGEELHHQATKRLARGGKVLDISLSAAPIRDRDGNVVAVSWVAEDVTEAKRHEEARYRLLLDSVTDHAIFLLDPEGHVTSWNKAAEHMKRWKEEEILGLHYSVLFPPEEREHGDPWTELKDATDKGRHDGIERRMRKDGELFDAHVTLSAMRDPNGALLGFVKVTRDVTAQRAWERKLQTGEERYKRLFNMFASPSLWCERPGQIVTANDSLLRLLGYEEPDLVGRPLKSLVDQADRERFENAAAAVQNGTPQDLRFAVVDRRSKSVDMAWRLTPIVVEGVTTGYFAVADVREPHPP